jgi:hypothetical protein
MQAGGALVRDDRTRGRGRRLHPRGQPHIHTLRGISPQFRRNFIAVSEIGGEAPLNLIAGLDQSTWNQCTRRECSIA